MSEEIEIPQRHIQAAELRRRCGDEVLGVALVNPFGEVTAWVAHCSTGPYLMTVREWEHYHHPKTKTT